MRRNPGDQSQSDEPLTIEQIRFLVERARGGDATALDRLRNMFDEHPEVWEQYSDLGRHISNEFIKQISSNDLALAESLPRRIEAMTQELRGATSTPLEELLIEQIVSNWLVVRFCEAAVAHQGDVSIRLAAFNVKRFDQSQRRYLAAIKTLATVRKLLPPKSGESRTSTVDECQTETDVEAASAPLRVRPRIKPRVDDLSDSVTARSSEVLDPLKMKTFPEIKLEPHACPDHGAKQQK